MPAIISNTNAVQFTGDSGTVMWLAGWDHATQANAANRTFKKQMAVGQALPADFAVGAIDFIDNEGGWEITDVIAGLNSKKARTTHISAHSGDPDGDGTQGPNYNQIGDNGRQPVTLSAAAEQ